MAEPIVEVDNRRGHSKCPAFVQVDLHISVSQMDFKFRLVLFGKRFVRLEMLPINALPSLDVESLLLADMTNTLLLRETGDMTPATFFKVKTTLTEFQNDFAKFGIVHRP